MTRIFEASERENQRRILSLLRAGAGGSLLDLGCHDGAFTLEVASRIGAEKICGVEFLEDHARAARVRGIEVAAADLNGALPFADESFDVVHANQVIEHLGGTDMLLSEIRRMLKPGGVAVISTNNLASWHNVFSLLFGYQPMPAHVSDELIVGNPLNPQHGLAHEDRGRSHLRIFTARSLAELCVHHGLIVRRIVSTGYYPLPPFVARAASRVDRWHGAFLIAILGKD